MVDIRARFRPHPRGFGFLTPVGAGGVTPTTFQAQTPGGTTSTFDQAFTPPQLATTLVADDLVDAVVEIDDKGAAAKQVALVDRPRRMLVGVVQPAAGQLVLEADQRLTAGWVELDDALAHQLSGAIGRQVVVLGAERPDDGPLGRALVAGPHVVGSPDAVRARAVVVALDRAAPSLVPGGAEAAGLEPVETATTHTRLVGLLAGGGRGAAHELATEGPVPGSELIPADRRDEPCVTVDAASTRDLDDAVAASWDGGTDTSVRVAVHIADVGGTVGVDSAADVYARTVATSAYLTAGPNAPMLDPALSEDALSLLPDEDRQTVSVRFSVTPEGTLEDVVVETALARSRAQVTYAALDAWLTGQPDGVRTLAEPEADVVNTLLEAAAEASRRLGAERDARATLEDLFEQAEVEPAVVEGRLTTVDAEPHAAAYRLVERLMVAANEAVASWLVARDVPALYRAHVGLDPERAGRLRAAAELAGAEVPALASDDTPDADAVMAQVLAEIDRLQAEGRDEDREVLVAAATSSTARATYDPDPSHHRGLAATPYCHFTSPIRRYADLVVHRQIRAALAEESPPHPLDSLGALATWLDARTGAVNHAQALERAELWAQLVDRGFLDGAEPAVVTGVNPAGLRVRLPRLGLNGFVTAERALDLPAGERGKLEVDGYGLSTTSGPWRLGTRVMVRAAGLDDTGRPIFRLGEVPARA